MENDYPYEELILNLLGAHLDVFQQAGHSLRDAISHFNFSSGHQHLRSFNQPLNWQEHVRVENLVGVVTRYYSDLSPQQLAIELKEDFNYDAARVIKGVLSQFRKLKATGIFAVILHPQVYPDLQDEAMSLGKLVKANTLVSYDESDLLTAFTQNYPQLSKDQAEDYVSELFGKKKKQPIAALAGTFVTETQWWGTHFSPLLIREDGTVALRGGEITYTYYEEDKRLKFEHEVSPGTFCFGDIIFSADNLSFHGGIQPRSIDAGVNFSGERI
jgi:hypothetical protein